ncbi:T9SS type A sorting domain-containing protein [Spirosoma lituiforme]
MNTSLKTFCLALIVSGLSLSAQAQVKFKLTRSDAGTYTVSLVPDKALADRQAITGTMQVTMKVKATEGFVLGSIKSLQPEVDWDKGTVIKSPDGASDYDYVSVALQSMATRQFSYATGKEVPLFTFQNVGEEAASVQLIDNNKDPLVLTKGNKFNVQNHISVLGFGRTNAYTGNLADDTPGNKKVGLKQVYPNPAKDRVTVTWVNYLNGFEGQIALLVADAGTGKIVSQETSYMRSGSNSKELSVEQLPVGQYIIYLERGGIRLGPGQKMLIAR